jgi:alpha-mannosidase
LIRLFNAAAQSPEQVISLGFEPASVELTELDGRCIERLAIKRMDGRYAVRISVPRFGIRTLRISH